MTTKTFVESIVIRAHNADRIAEALVGAEAGRLVHVPSVPIDQCQWSGCSEFPTYLAGQWDDETQNEDESTFRYYCFQHALRIQQTLDE